MIVRKPISSQARPTCAATWRLPSAVPARNGAISMAGTDVLAITTSARYHYCGAYEYPRIASSCQASLRRWHCLRVLALQFFNRPIIREEVDILVFESPAAAALSNMWLEGEECHISQLLKVIALDKLPIATLAFDAV